LQWRFQEGPKPAPGCKRVPNITRIAWQGHERERNEMRVGIRNAYPGKKKGIEKKQAHDLVSVKVAN